jgi:large subunit ribosomal protein L28
MARVCDICKKGSLSGNRIIRHGLAKSKGGIGLHTTGITARSFRPNVQKIRVNVNGTHTRLSVCTACIKAGKIVKS